jgi:hypothetical protein
MPTRSQVISRQIAKYDKIITADRSISDVELAVFKLAICQLVDAAFSGGGGSGSISAATVQGGIESATNLASILARLTSIDNKTIDISGIVTAIQTAADIDTIIARLTSLDNSKLTASDVTLAIQNAADIDTIIDKLTSVVQNTASSTNNITVNASNIVNSYTQSVVSVTSTSNNLLFNANPNRRHLVIINKSPTNPIDLFLGAVGTFGQGLPLLPNQPYEINSANLYLGTINARPNTGITIDLALAEGI